MNFKHKKCPQKVIFIFSYFVFVILLCIVIYSLKKKSSCTMETRDVLLLLIFYAISSNLFSYFKANKNRVVVRVDLKPLNKIAILNTKTNTNSLVFEFKVN